MPVQLLRYLTDGVWVKYVISRFVNFGFKIKYGVETSK